VTAITNVRLANLHIDPGGKIKAAAVELDAKLAVK
jgi:hypothetical protein